VTESPSLLGRPSAVLLAVAMFAGGLAVSGGLLLPRTRTSPEAPGPSAGAGGPAGQTAPDERRDGDPAALRRFFGPGLTPLRHGTFGLERATVDGGVLKVRYPAHSASPRATGEDSSGAQLYLARARGPVDEARLTYRLRLPAGFDFVRGGKLPGLYGGTVTSGGSIPDGTNGFSTRYMWRARGAGEVYAYLPSSVEHGTSLGRGAWRWPTGRWVEVEQHLRLNTPGRADGLLEVRVDGRRVWRAADLTFRTTRSLRIDGVFFSTFFGGGDVSWATPVDQAAEFSDLRLTP